MFLSRLLLLFASSCIAQKYPTIIDLRTIAPAVESNDTCGTPPEDFFYRLADGTYEQRVCNSSSPQLAHGPGLIFDNDPTSWWQSENGLSNASFTVNFSQPYELIYLTMVMANSYPPVGLAFEKSTDYGQTFEPLEYQVQTSTDCMGLFGVAYQIVPTNASTVVCGTSLPSAPWSPVSLGWSFVDGSAPHVSLFVRW